MDPHEEALQGAIRDLESGVFTSQRAAAKAWAVPRTSIQRRLQGSVPHAIAHQQQQRLTPEQESFIVDWILEEDARSLPPSHARVREMATRILKLGGDHEPLGQRWISSFLTRQPRVASIVGRSIEASRAEAATPDQILAFLELFHRTRIELNIRVEDIWNMDETGIALGVCTNSQVIARAGKRKAYVKTPGDREWVSILETVSAAGRKLRCMVIFKGQSLQTTWFPSRLVPDWLYTTSKNGWTSHKIGSEWLRSIFIPETQPNGNRWRILILDGHGSHVDIEFMLLCRQHRIWTLYLPPHASHVLQPLDLAPFSVLKSGYRAEIRALSALDDAAPVKKERFISSYYHAREIGLSERVIRAGWRATGICPYNPSVVIHSSQVSARPITPPPPTQHQSSTDLLFSTPKRAQDVYQAQQQLLQSEPLSRSTRLVLGKVGKAISLSSAYSAQLEAKVQCLKHQLDQLQGTETRKRIRVNPNERFSNAESIKAAIDKAAAQAEQASTKKTEKAAKAAAAQAAAHTLASMCTQFQI
jgi:hypothetical protein